MSANPGRRRSRGIEAIDLWVNLEDRTGARWRFRVYDSRRHSYKSQDFQDGRKPEGEAWAERMRARFKLGVDSSGAVPFAHVAQEVLDAAGRQGRSASYTGYMKQTFELATRFIDDLRAPDVLRRANLFIDSLRDMRHRKHNGERKRTTPALAPSPATLNQRIKHLRRLGAYAVRHDLVPKNPFANLDLRPTGHHAKAVFTLAELRTMMAKGAEHPWLVNAAIYAYTGLRLHEATALDWRDILWTERRIRVRCGKGDKDRVTFLQPELADILRPIAKPAGPVLSEESRTRTNQGHRTDLRGFLAHCRIDRGERTIHSFRHTWTALSLACGTNAFMTMSWLGHARADITATYAREQDLYVEETRAWPRGGEFYLMRPDRVGEDVQPTASAVI